MPLSQEEITQKAQELNAYCEALERAISGTAVAYRTNTDRVHNAVVMSSFFSHASTDIYMYCGEMSVFRRNFFSHIADEVSLPFSQGIRDRFEQGICQFFSRPDTRLHVLVEEFHESYIDETICPGLFHQMIQKGRIDIRLIQRDFLFRGKLSHFCYCSEPSLYRFEVDKSSHEAICVFHDDEQINDARERFDLLKEYSEPVRIPYRHISAWTDQGIQGIIPTSYVITSSSDGDDTYTYDTTAQS